MLDRVTEGVVVVGMVAVLLGCEREKSADATPAAGTPAAASSKAAAGTNTSSVSSSAQPQAEITRGVADFDEDTLIACVHATVRYDPTLQFTSLGTEAVLMLIDEGLVGGRGGDAVLTDRKRDLTEMLYLMMFELPAGQRSKLTADQQKQLAAQRDAMAEILAEAPKEFEKEGWLTVENCEFPNRTPLGTCENSDGGKSFDWSLLTYHFDVKSTSDSDSAMKNCLSAGGKWTAADDFDVARERVRQHGREVEKRMDKHIKEMDKAIESFRKRWK